MAQEKRSLDRFEMSKEDEAMLHSICREVKNDFLGEWSQSMTAVALRRMLVKKGLKLETAMNSWLLPLLSKGSNSSALRQAVFEAKAEKAKLAANYADIA